ncbi:FxsA family protein [Sulfurimonas marina]|uniref:FxsA family protein n=1 Tax=Sulfurimonas marina TaxID=2590551 RepID=A0A7M1AX55_9BACT|nr:FxsA family protein [Sulfurimonas marina]QOP40952.1 FxsA family protein [Sulfurimonas marina]
MVYFLIYLFLEVLISVNISSAIGGLATFFEILASAFVGIAILVNFRNTLFENMKAVSYNCIDLQEFQRLNLFTLFGAILLIIPGFLTDILGLLLQFSAITSMIVNRYNVQSKSCNSSAFEDEEKLKKDKNDVIDVEIIEHNSSTK